MTDEPHSAAYFGPERDFWWNLDQLDLIARERGKIALGEGNSSLGDLVPGYFAEAGLVDVEAYLSDKTTMMIPPYAGEEQQALKAQMLDEARGYWGWSREEAQRYYDAGGGADFDAAWERRMAEVHAAAAAVRAGTFHSAGATILYLVAGRRPCATGRDRRESPP